MSQDIRKLKERIVAVEREIEAAKKTLAQLRLQVPREEFRDYEFLSRDAERVRLSQLFDGRHDLLVVHNMGRACPYCTLWADGFNGVLDHILDRTAFVLVSPDPPEVQREFARSRGWRLPMVSERHSTFSRDAGFLTGDASRLPGVSSFFRDESGRIRRVASATFQPGDDFCSLFSLFDLLEEPGNGWAPKLSYP